MVKFNSTESGLIFGMSVNQTAATLAAVIIGYNVGIFNETLLTGTIMMIIHLLNWVNLYTKILKKTDFKYKGK